MKLFLILVGILFLLALVFVVYCCLVMASIADSRMEKLHPAQCQPPSNAPASGSDSAVNDPHS